MDFLLLLDKDSPADVLSGQAAIVHSVSPRLFVIRSGPATRAELAALTGVAAITDCELPQEYQQILNPQEMLFATAFAASGTSKQRVGEGLPWDAPGFEPPDPPADTATDTEQQSSSGSESIQQEGERQND